MSPETAAAAGAALTKSGLLNQLLPAALGLVSSAFGVDHDVHPQALELNHGADAAGAAPTLHEFGGDPVYDHKPGESLIQTETPPEIANDHRPLMESARASAANGGWSEAKTNAFLKVIHDNYDAIANGSDDLSKFTIQTENGTVTISKSTLAAHSGEEAIVGNGAGKGGYGAERRTLDLNTEQQAVRISFTYSENGGPVMRETVDFADRCSNPVLNVRPDEVVPTAVVAPVEAATGPKEYEVREVKSDCTTGCAPNETLGTVTRTVPTDSVWEDKDKDGRFWEEKHQSGGLRGAGSRESVLTFDGGEFKGLSPETVRKDYAELVALGYKNDFIVYNITDAEGKNIVFCVHVDAEGNPKSYSLFFGNHADDIAKGIAIPEGHAKKYELYTSGKMLMEDLSKEKLMGSK